MKKRTDSIQRCCEQVLTPQEVRYLISTYNTQLPVFTTVIRDGTTELHTTLTKLDSHMTLLIILSEDRYVTALLSRTYRHAWIYDGHNPNGQLASRTPSAAAAAVQLHTLFQKLTGTELLEVIDLSCAPQEHPNACGLHAVRNAAWFCASGTNINEQSQKTFCNADQSSADLTVLANKLLKQRERTLKTLRQKCKKTATTALNTSSSLNLTATWTVRRSRSVTLSAATGNHVSQPNCSTKAVRGRPAIPAAGTTPLSSAKRSCVGTLRTEEDELPSLAEFMEGSRCWHHAFTLCTCDR